MERSTIFNGKIQLWIFMFNSYVSHYQRVSCLGWIWILDAHLPDAEHCWMMLDAFGSQCFFCLTKHDLHPERTMTYHDTQRGEDIISMIYQWYINDISMIYQWYINDISMISRHFRSRASVVQLFLDASVPNSCPRLCIFCKNTSARAGPGKVSPGVRGRHLKWTFNS